MSTKTTKAPIDPKSIRELKEQLSTDDLYRELDQYLRAKREEDNIKKRSMAKKIFSEGEQLMQEIEEKKVRLEAERLSMIEFIHKNSQEKFITLKEATQMDYEEIKRVHARVLEWKKPIWRRFLNIFR